MNRLIENINGWVQSGPMGNDKQFTALPYIASALGIGASLFGGAKSGKGPSTPSISPEQIEQYMLPVQEQIDKMGGVYDDTISLSKNIMDPSSALNQQRFNLLKQQGQEQLALQNLLARRQSAAMGQDSGITFSNAMQRQQALGRDILGQYNQSMLGQQNVGLGLRGQGMGLLGSMLQGQLGVSENIAQAAIAQNQAQRDAEMYANQAQGGFYSGLGSSLLTAGLESIL